MRMARLIVNTDLTGVADDVSTVGPPPSVIASIRQGERARGLAGRALTDQSPDIRDQLTWLVVDAECAVAQEGDASHHHRRQHLLRELHQGGATICMVTHDPRYTTYADRTIHLFDGRIVEESAEATSAADDAS